jgi:hypothetical protein
MEAATCLSLLDRHDCAIPVYETSLAQWPDEQLRRDRGLCLARLTGAYVGREDIDRACETGVQALAVVATAPSSRAVRELHGLRTRLLPWRRDARVSELSNGIRSLIAA